MNGIEQDRTVLDYLGVKEEEKKSVGKVLEERGSRYGSFRRNADISQRLCEIVREASRDRDLGKNKQEPLSNHQLEALEMICHKMARILSGDASYEDNWVDIQGYAQLGMDPR